MNAVEIEFPEKGSSGLRKNIDTIRDLIRTFRADIVHTNTNYDRTAGAYAARKTTAKHVTSCHSLESIGHNITHYIRNRFLTSHFICDGKSIQELITRKNSIPINRTTVVHNGIDQADYARDINGRKKIRSEFRIEDNEIVIGNTGRLVPFKGQKYLLKSFKVVVSECANVRLIIVGDGELENELKDEAKMLGLNDRITFAGFRDDLKDVYSAFDIYAHSSLGGGGELFPFSILYSMAQKLPVVATGIGDIPEMISEGVNGFLVEEKSPYRFAQKLIQLTRDEQLRKRLGVEGGRLLIEKFSFEKMIGEITAIYRKVL
jgi:glycosyltransferase involved in cell wall biosynthesis